MLRAEARRELDAKHEERCDRVLCPRAREGAIDDVRRELIAPPPLGVAICAGSRIWECVDTSTIEQLHCSHDGRKQIEHEKRVVTERGALGGQLVLQTEATVCDSPELGADLITRAPRARGMRPGGESQSQLREAAERIIRGKLAATEHPDRSICGAYTHRLRAAWVICMLKQCAKLLPRGFAAFVAWHVRLAREFAEKRHGLLDGIS